MSEAGNPARARHRPCRMRLALGAFAAFGLTLAGCAAQQGQPAGPAADLTGRTFLSTSATEDGQPRQLAAGTRVSLWFADDGRLVANAGCNTMSGRVGLAGGKLDVPGGLAVTEMGCDAPLHEQDEWLAGLLGSAPSWRLDGDELVVTGAGTELVLLDRSVAEPDLPVEGTKWLLDTIFSGDTASSVPDGAYLVFAGGRVTGSTGCNSLGGEAAINGSSIRFGQLTTTRRACRDDLAPVEAAMLAVLRGDVPFELESGQLRLNPDGERGLVLRG